MANPNAARPITLTTPLGPDALQLQTLRVEEKISETFALRLSALAEGKTSLPFHRLLGEPVNVTMSFGATRYFNGIVSRIREAGYVYEGAIVAFTRYELEVVPELWLLKRKRQSRIFQGMSVPDILRAVLRREWGLAVDFRLAGSFPAREYCVQYRESDFDFVSRLMEEEGIHYCFQHSEHAHTMIVADTPPDQRLDLPGGAEVRFDPAGRGDGGFNVVTAFAKEQSIRSGVVTLWDHCFEFQTQSDEVDDPHTGRSRKRVHVNHLQGQALQRNRTIDIGSVKHPLDTAHSNRLEIYDYPGDYAYHFDGVDRGGTYRPRQLDAIGGESQRIAELRLQEEAARGIELDGAGSCPRFAAGHLFVLSEHGAGDGAYVLTGVRHEAANGDPARSGAAGEAHYRNEFTCLPVQLRFRPARTTPRPVIAGLQTATVVALDGETVSCDRYGRVKVQFHWDRAGLMDLDSSCWVRVSQPWAGPGFGAVNLPRVGHEVVVGFLEGNPDRPLVLGSVYNGQNMPPFELPKERYKTGMRTNSVGDKTDTSKTFSGLVFDDDRNGGELMQLHSENDMSFSTEKDHVTYVGGHQVHKVLGHSVTVIGGLPGVGSGSGGGGGQAEPLFARPPSSGGGGGSTNQPNQGGTTKTTGTGSTGTGSTGTGSTGTGSTAGKGSTGTGSTGTGSTGTGSTGTGSTGTGSTGTGSTGTGSTGTGSTAGKGGTGTGTGPGGTGKSSSTGTSSQGTGDGNADSSGSSGTSGSTEVSGQQWIGYDKSGTLGFTTNCQYVYGVNDVNVVGLSLQEFAGWNWTISANPLMYLPAACTSFPPAQKFAGLLGLLGGQVQVNLGSALSIQIGPQVAYKFGPSFTFNSAFGVDDLTNPAKKKEAIRHVALLSVGAALSAAAITCGGLDLGKKNDAAVAELGVCKTMTGVITAGMVGYLWKALGADTDEKRADTLSTTVKGITGGATVSAEFNNLKTDVLALQTHNLTAMEKDVTDLKSLLSAGSDEISVSEGLKLNQAKSIVLQAKRGQGTSGTAVLISSLGNSGATPPNGSMKLVATKGFALESGKAGIEVAASGPFSLTTKKSSATGSSVSTAGSQGKIEITAEDASPIDLTASNGTITLKSKDVLLEGTTSITLKVGSNSLKITSSGVEIKGLKAQIVTDLQITLQTLKNELKAQGPLNGQNGLVNLS